MVELIAFKVKVMIKTLHYMQFRQVAEHKLNW